MLCLVSQHLRQIAEPLLYASVKLVWKKDRPPPIISLLRGIQRRPQLSNYVQILTFHAPFTSTLCGRVIVKEPQGFSYGDLPPSISVDRSELASLITIIRDINSPFRELWIQELENGVMDAFVTLLLSLAPNITHLRLTGVFARKNGLLGMMVKASVCHTSDCKLPQFQHLQKVDFGPQLDPFRSRETKNTADVLPLLYLPAVRLMSTEVDNVAIFAWPTYTPNLSNITSLSLKILREGYLGRILALTKNLKTLNWEWKYEPNLRNEINNSVINLDHIAKDLSLVQGTLENLHLSADVSIEHHDYPLLTINGSLRALRDFEKLHNLEISQLFLIGFSSDDNLGSLEELMPKNIHHLTINDDIIWLEEITWKDRDLFMFLQHWWENLATCTPYFHSFELSLLYTDDEWCVELRNELSDLCAQLGIRLKMFKRAKDLY